MLLPLRLLLRPFRFYSGDFLLPICATFFQRYVPPFLSFFLFLVIYCKFLISPFFLSFLFFFFFFFCDCRSSVFFWVVVSISYFLRVFWVFMVGSSEVRIACPSISFLFVHLGGSLGVFPHVESFVF